MPTPDAMARATSTVIRDLADARATGTADAIGRAMSHLAGMLRRNRSQATAPPTSGHPAGGQRACSWIVLGVEAGHDGSAEALAEHLLVDLRAALRRWGLEVGTTWVESATTVLPGDDLSAGLPVIGSPLGRTWS